jgi:RNA-directed DNA polymerase
MIDFNIYKNKFSDEAARLSFTDEEIKFFLNYAEKLNSQNLPIIFDQVHFSQLVGYDYDYILKVCNSNRFFYKEFTITKRNGKLRRIDEPLPSLKEIQNWILTEILNNSVDKFVSPVAKAYIHKRNIRDNARFHRNKKIVVCLDIVNFFGTISYKQIYAIFRHFGYNKSVSTLLSNLCILDGSLPQGAPTSPMLSNLIFYHIDNELFDFCKKHKIMYTRYADDLSFSGDFKVGLLISYASKLLDRFGFCINRKKTKVISQGRSQQITGIVVNKKIQVPREYRQKLRQIIYYIIKYGLQDHIKRINYSKSPQSYIYHLIGKTNYILLINKQDKEAHKYMEFLKGLL